MYSQKNNDNSVLQTEEYGLLHFVDPSSIQSN